MENSLNAQHPYFYTINDESDLPSNEVYQTLQDEKGYIWIGCDAGLFRYNGFEFKPYRNDNLNGKSISNLFIDNQNTLWCRNFNGQILKLKSDSLIIVADYNHLLGNQFQVLFLKKGGFWKIQSKKISLHNENGYEINQINIQLSGPLIPNGIEMIEFENEVFYFIPYQGLFKIISNNAVKLIHAFDKKENNSFAKFFTFKNELFFIKNNEFTSIHSQKNVLTEIFKYNKNNESVEKIESFKNTNEVRYFSFYEDLNQKLWIGSSSGAFFIEQIQDIKNPKNILFKNLKISSIHQDNEKNYWFTDLQNGIHIVPKLDIVKSESKFNEILLDINKMKVWNNKIILGTYDGTILFFNPKDFIFEYPLELNKINGITVKEIEFYHQYIFLSRGHFLMYDTLTKKTILHSQIANARDFIIYNDIIYSINPENVTKTNIFNEKIESEKIVNRGGKKIVKCPKSNKIYIGLNQGFFYWENSNLVEIKDGKKSIFVNDFEVINDCVWLGTHNNGILIIKNGEIIQKIELKHIIKDISCKALYTNQKYVWFLSNSNLIRIKLDDLSIMKYSNNIGINPKDINCITHFNDDLILGGKRGIIKFPTEMEGEIMTKPTLFIEKINSENEYFEKNRTITLPYNFKNLKFDFISFSFQSKKDFMYEYRLIGLDTSWKEIAYNTPSVNFSSLKPGEYMFQLRSKNESNRYSEIVYQKIIVNRPIWQETWFFMLILFIIFLLFYSIYKNQIKKIRKKSEIEKKMIQSQLIALKSQMNPHFIFNSLNSIQSLILTNDIKNSNIYLTKFSQLMRKILETSDLEMIELEKEIEILNLYLSLEKLRFGDDFKFEIISNDLETFSIKIPPFLIQPFIENSVKHGLLHKKGEKMLSISFKIKNEFLICRIEDNGIGRDESHKIQQKLKNKHQSFSTESIKKRIELLNKDSKNKFSFHIENLNENQEEIGTLVIINFPIIN